MYKQFINTVIVVLITSFAIETQAQIEEVPEVKNKIQYGLRVSESFEGLTQSSNNDKVSTQMESIILLGAFVKKNKAEFSLNAGYRYIDGEFSYNFYKNWIGLAGVSYGDHWMEVRRSGNNYSYSYTDGDIMVTQYYLGAGYQNTWHRLKLKANVKIGGVNTSNAVAKGYIRSYEYSYNTNKKALKTDHYNLSPTLLYGASLYLELLPREWKNRKTPLTPFASLSIMGNANSNTSRKIIIEEWVPGNVVYRETAAEHNLKYDLLNVHFQIGLKWYLKYK